MGKACFSYQLSHIDFTQRSKNRYSLLSTNQDLLLLAVAFHSMPKSTDIQTYWDPSAVEKAQSNVIIQREIIIMEKNKKLSNIMNS